MSRLQTLLQGGRPNGLRARVRGILGQRAESAPAGASGAPATPASSLEPAERALSLRKEAPRDVTPPDGYEVVLHKDALDPGTIIEIIIAGTAIAVANVDGTFYAIANACKHAEGPLGEGAVEGCVVVCPYHGWKYDLRTGKCQTVPGQAVASYPVQIVGDAVCVKM